MGFFFKEKLVVFSSCVLSEASFSGVSLWKSTSNIVAQKTEEACSGEAGERSFPFLDSMCVLVPGHCLSPHPSSQPAFGSSCAGPARIAQCDLAAPWQGALSTSHLTLRGFCNATAWGTCGACWASYLQPKHVCGWGRASKCPSPPPLRWTDRRLVLCSSTGHAISIRGGDHQTSLFHSALSCVLKR